MTVEEILLFTLILLFALAGIGVGAHTAFVLADADKNQKPRKHKYVDGPASPDESKRPWITPPWRQPEPQKKNLTSRIHSQDDVSFAEFGCQLTGAEPDKQRAEAMHHQDDSYHYLDKRGPVEGESDATDVEQAIAATVASVLDEETPEAETPPTAPLPQVDDTVDDMEPHDAAEVTIPTEEAVSVDTQETIDIEVLAQPAPHPRKRKRSKHKKPPQAAQ